MTKHGEVFPKDASRGVWGSLPQPPEAGFFGRFRRNVQIGSTVRRQSISINFPKSQKSPKTPKTPTTSTTLTSPCLLMTLMTLKSFRVISH